MKKYCPCKDINDKIRQGRELLQQGLLTAAGVLLHCAAALLPQSEAERDFGTLSPDEFARRHARSAHADHPRR